MRTKMPHLLIAEDDPTLQLLWKIQCSAWQIPLRVTIVTDGQEALSVLSEDCPDLVITDIDMPRLDGRCLVNIMSVEPSFAHIPVVVVSGSPMDDLQDRPSIVGCYRKPAPFDDVRRCIATLLRPVSH